jgi:hypothetical protein
MAEHQLPKLTVRVRFPSSAPENYPWSDTPFPERPDSTAINCGSVGPSTGPTTFRRAYEEITVLGSMAVLDSYAPALQRPGCSRRSSATPTASTSQPNNSSDPRPSQSSTKPTTTSLDSPTSQLGQLSGHTCSRWRPKQDSIQSATC